MPPRPSANAPDPDHLWAVLGRSPLFGGLPEEARRRVAERLRWLYVPGGEALYRPGDPTDDLFLVVHGRLRVHLDLDRDGRIDADEVVDEVGEGGVVGDVGMLSDDPHDEWVLAVRDTEVGALRESELWALVAEHPALARRLGHHAVHRLRAAFRPALVPERVNVAIVPADPEAPLRAFAAALAEALGATDPLLYVNAERFDAELGAGTSRDDVDAWDHTDRRVVRWICEQERRHRFVLYEADGDYTPWTRRCVRMADRILVVARAGADPALTDGERNLYERRDASALVPTELVLIHPDDAALPEGTEAWLTPRPEIGRVHHVQLGQPAHLQRLARFLAGRAVGVVLGGGGARGTAQMGMIAALRDAGVPIDRVGGTSAGGGVAAMVALGWDLQTMRTRNRKAFVEMAPFQQWTVPFHSMLSKHRVEAVSRYLYGKTLIEDLWIDFFCVTCDLVAGERVVHRRGSVARAILATTALPAVLPPVVWDGRLLVDGGLMDNNPVAVMRQGHPGPVILFDVGQAEARLIDPDATDLPNNLEAYWNRFKPFGKHARVPTIPEIVLRTMTVSRPDQDPAEGCDLYVRPEVDRYGLTDFAAQEQLVAIGYNATMAALEKLADDPARCRRLGVKPEALRELPRMEVPKDLPARK